MSLGQKGRVASSATRAKLSESMKLAWQDPEKIKKFSKGRDYYLHHSNRTTIELLAMAALSDMGYDILVQVRLGRYMPDIVIESIKTIVEYDGSYWHSRPSRAERDAARNASHVRHGYRVVVLGEAAIREDCRQALLDAGIVPLVQSTTA